MIKYPTDQKYQTTHPFSSLHIHRDQLHSKTP